jgi:single-strand DNA-binding protein
VDRVGKEKQADFIPRNVFGKQAEDLRKIFIERSQWAIEGRIQTGSYENKKEKGLHKDVVAYRVEFVEWGDRTDRRQERRKTAWPRQKTVSRRFPSIDDDDIPSKRVKGAKNHGKEKTQRRLQKKEGLSVLR